MLSILIPTKDYDCSLLVEELHKQGEALGVPFEILVGEDGTQNLQLNKNADTLNHCRRIIEKKNTGRAAMRNTLAQEAQYPYILFIDSDAIAENSLFISNYIQAIKQCEVVCGGLYHANKLSDKSCTLRYKYEKEADKERKAEIRNLAPYDKFTTFNFAINRELFLSIQFNEEIKRYGYEDTLFGKELEKRNVKIMHINNMLLHNGLECNEIYLAKVEQALATLNDIKEEIKNTPLLQCAAKIEQLHLKKIFLALWKRTQHLMRNNLLGEKPSLTILKIYKLGYFLSIKG